MIRRDAVMTNHNDIWYVTAASPAPPARGAHDRKPHHSSATKRPLLLGSQIAQFGTRTTPYGFCRNLFNEWRILD